MTNAGAGGQKVLGVFGSSGSGKTVYLTMLVHQCQRQEYPREFEDPRALRGGKADAEVKPRRTWRIEFDGNTGDFVTANYRTLASGEWPQATQEETARPISFNICNNFTGVAFGIRSYDIPGELFRLIAGDEFDRTHIEKDRRPVLESFRAHFTACDAYIFLLDGKELRDETARMREITTHEVVRRYLLQISGGRPIRKPAVFAFSKADVAPDDLEDADAFARATLGSEYDNICALFPNATFASVSSVGRVEDNPPPGAKARPILTKERIRVTEPFFRIIMQMSEAVYRRRLLQRIAYGAAAAVVLAFGLWAWRAIAVRGYGARVSRLCREAEDLRAKGNWLGADQLLREAEGLLPGDPRTREIRQRGPAKEFANLLGMPLVFVPRPVSEGPGRPGFYMGKCEVSRSQYAGFVKAAGHAQPPVSDARFSPTDSAPVIGVSWQDAMDFCGWLTRTARARGDVGPDECYRLPTEEEWELAAAGQSGFRYPWGDSPPGPSLCNIEGAADGYEFCAPVGSYPGGASPWGCLDMSGNVWEWCLNRYDEDGGSDPDATMVIRGGGWNSPPRLATTAFRKRCRASERTEVIGFRCVKVPAGPDDMER